MCGRSLGPVLGLAQPSQPPYPMRSSTWKHLSTTRLRVGDVTSYCDPAVAWMGEMRVSLGSGGLSWSLVSSRVSAALSSSLKSRFFLPGDEGPGCGPRWRRGLLPLWTWWPTLKAPPQVGPRGGRTWPVPHARARWVFPLGWRGHHLPSVPSLPQLGKTELEENCPLGEGPRMTDRSLGPCLTARLLSRLR